MANTGRHEDIMELYRILNSESDPRKRAEIKETIHILKNESGIIRSMREALIKAHKNSNKWEIKDIHDYIKNKRKYRYD